MQPQGPRAAQPPGAPAFTPDQPMQGKPGSTGKSGYPPARQGTTGQSSGRNKDEAPKPQAR